VTSGGIMHVKAIKMVFQDAGSGRYAVDGQVKITDLSHVSVAGATVTVEWTLPDGSHLSKQAVTRSNGIAPFRIKSTLTGTYRICVIEVTKAGYTYDPNQNHVTCKTITVP